MIEMFDVNYDEFKRTSQDMRLMRHLFCSISGCALVVVFTVMRGCCCSSADVMYNPLKSST